MLIAPPSAVKQLSWRAPDTIATMSRKQIVAFAGTVIILVMAGALIYEAFDIHDPKPFPIDPEMLLYMFGSMMVLCVGTVALIVPLLNLNLSFSGMLPLSLLGLPHISMQRRQPFEVERLLFSPPLSVTSLRI